MAKSKNSTSPPSARRRGVLAGAAALPADPGAAPPETDPVWQMWQDWLEAKTQLRVWCRKHHRLEKRLLRTVGFPRVSVPVPDADKTVYAFMPEGIDKLLGRTAETRALRKRLRTELATHRSRWDKAAKAIGFDRACVAYDAAERRWQSLTDTLLATPAASLPGIAAKLALMVETGEAKPHDPEFPWPQLRSVLADLIRVAGLEEPGLRI